MLAKGNQILGFYSIVAGAYHNDKGVQGYPYIIPCVLLGRLGVDKTQQGQGLSNYLVIHAIETIKRLSNDVGIAMILVELKGLHLVDFYKKFGFKQVSHDSLTMYLKVNTI